MEQVWKIKGESKEFKTKFEKIMGDKDIDLSPKIIKYLIHQGHDTPDAIKKIVNFSEKDIPDTLLLKDAEKFLTELQKAIKENKNIVVYTDYDMDGIGSAAVMMRGIKALGGNPKFFINNRFTEGYGINPKGMERLLTIYPDTNFIVTCDNGIKAMEGIKYAMDKGIEVIVSDHHEPNDDGTIPECLAVVDAKRLDDTYPFKDLCGCGLAYKLLKELHKRMNVDDTEFKKCLTYVAMSTIADLVSLTEENRLYVKEGLRRIKEEEFICFKALREQTETKNIDEVTIGFTYAPMANAVGRLTGDVTDVVNMLLNDDYIEASKYVQEMIAINKERQELTSEMWSLAQFNIDINMKERNPFIMVWGKFHEGVAGIVASKITEKYGKPSIVLCEQESIEGQSEILYKGSARSVEGFDLKASFDKIKDKFVAYGGHEMAAGLTVSEDNLKDIQDALNKMALDFEKGLPEEEVIYVDFPMKPEEITMKFVNEYEMLKPYGQGLPKPIVGVTGFEVDKCNFMGKDQEHLKLLNTDTNLSIIWFSGVKRYVEMGSPKIVKCLGYPSKNIFAGKTSIQFMVEKSRMRAM